MSSHGDPGATAEQKVAAEKRLGALAAAKEGEETATITSVGSEAAKPAATSTSMTLQLIILGLVVFVNSGNVLFLKYSRLVPKAPGQGHYLKATVVLSSEFCKFFLSMGLLSMEMGLGKAFNEIKEKILTDPKGTLKVGVPAFLYTIQNYLFILAASKLSPAVLQVTCQTKTLTTALFTTILLGKKFSLLQWGALLILMAGVATTELAHMTGVGGTAVPAVHVDAAKAAADHTVGLLAVAGVCVCSGFAGVYIEKVLKGSNVSIWLRNMQLSLCSLFVATALVAVNSGKAIMAVAKTSPNGIIGGFFQGWDWTTLVVLGFQCSGGLIVAIVLKKASAVLKNFATAVAIIFIGIAADVLPVFHVCVVVIHECLSLARWLTSFHSLTLPHSHSLTLPRAAAHKLRPQSRRFGSAQSSWCAASFSTRGRGTMPRIRLRERRARSCPPLLMTLRAT